MLFHYTKKKKGGDGNRKKNNALQNQNCFDTYIFILMKNDPSLDFKTAEKKEKLQEKIFI